MNAKVEASFERFSEWYRDLRVVLEEHNRQEAELAQVKRQNENLKRNLGAERALANRWRALERWARGQYTTTMVPPNSTLPDDFKTQAEAAPRTALYLVPHIDRVGYQWPGNEDHNFDLLPDGYFSQGTHTTPGQVFVVFALPRLDPTP